jgi:carbon storage regulator
LTSFFLGKIEKQEENKMLVLTRRIGERVVIPTLGITIEVVNVKGNAVRLGFTAPREIPIHRSEVYQRDPEAVLEGAQVELCARR